jgi:stage II sporulation protein D
MRKTFFQKYLALALCLITATWAAAGCATNPSNPKSKTTLPDGADTPKPTLSGTPGPDASERPIDRNIKLPAKLKTGADGEPVLNVYVKSDQKNQQIPIETYLEGVLAGEMKNDWPLEALKAQAILARTFVLKFLEEKQSKYPGVDISTDIEEAQAYDAEGVNARVRQAVAETKGLALSAQGTLPFGWFHAHSGGLTAMAKEGLEYEKDEPPYTHIVKGRESEKAPDDAAEWTASFSADAVMKAAGKLGASGDRLASIQIGQRGESGRATTLVVNGASVPAASFRIALGSTEMKSTMLSEIKLEGGKVTLKGKGYGHGVGMSQWGAYGLAEQGEKADAIVRYYFQGVDVVRLW